jgi:hypothetical protein
MQMRHFGLTGQADLSEDGRPAPPGPELRQASLLQMAVLGAPALAVVDYQAVSAFLARHGCAPGNPDRNVQDTVPSAKDACCGEKLGLPAKNINYDAVP